MSYTEEASDEPGDGDPKRAIVNSARAELARLQKNDCFRTLHDEQGVTLLTDQYGANALSYGLDVSVRPSNLAKLHPETGNYCYAVDVEQSPTGDKQSLQEVMGCPKWTKNFLNRIPQIELVPEDKTAGVTNGATLPR